MSLPFTYTLRRSQRASRVRITVKPGKVEVVAPPQIPEALIAKFVAAKQTWVMHALEKVASRQSQPGEALIFYRPGEAMAYQGVVYPIRLQTTFAKRSKVEFSEGFTVYLAQDLPLGDGQAASKSALAAWLKEQAKQQVGKHVENHASKHGLIPHSIAIKSQKSRWGSCGIHNDIHINWLLMAAPPQVLEYVVVHELCHVRVKNHSADFWQLVALHLPYYQTHRAWLKQYGGHLLASWA